MACMVRDVMRNSLETYFVLLSIISSPWSNIKTLWWEWNLVSSRKFGNTHLHFLPFAVLVLLSDGPPWVNWELSLVLCSVYCLGPCRLGPRHIFVEKDLHRKEIPSSKAEKVTMLHILSQFLQESDKGQIFYWSIQTCSRIRRLFDWLIVDCHHAQKTRNCPISDFSDRTPKYFLPLCLILT